MTRIPTMTAARRAAHGTIASAMAAFLALGTLSLGACGSGQARPGTGSGPPVMLTLEALDGGTIDVARYQGQIVVLHVFTTWSLGAQGDVAQLLEVQRQYQDRVTVVGISLDPDGHRLVAPWRRANGIGYLIGLADHDTLSRSSLGAITEVPTTIVLDARGRVSQRIARPLGDRELPPLLERMTTGR